jgi:integrase
MGRLQRGYIYEASGFFFVRYCVSEIVDGQAQRVQRSYRLCEKGGKYYARDCKQVKLLRDEYMLKINQNQQAPSRLHRDMPISEFWEHRYLPYCEEVLALTGQPRRKPSTVYGYKQIWNQHLKTHFAKMTLQEYEPYMGTQFLQGLTGSQCKSTLKHIKALGSSIFKLAVAKRQVKVNPWYDVQMPDDAIEPERTEHYTLEEAEDLISALVDHVDCQLVIALSCFLALRPGEIAALKWEDFDSDSVNIRRCVVRGNVGTPKTLESMANLPLVDPRVLIPLKLWRKKSNNPKEGWVFPSTSDTPVDLHNMIARVIVPHVSGASECKRCKLTPKKSSARWKGLYAGRRGAATAVIEVNNGNLAVGQALLRHKSATTTATFYKKAITDGALRAGMKALAETHGK